MATYDDVDVQTMLQETKDDGANIEDEYWLFPNGERGEEEEHDGHWGQERGEGRTHDEQGQSILYLRQRDREWGES